MKRQFFKYIRTKILLVILLGVTFCISGCGETMTGNSGENPKGEIKEDLNQSEEESKQEEKRNAGDCVEDAYQADFTVELDPEYQFQVQYHVPRITVDCEGAKILNQQILVDCQDVKQPDNEEDCPMWYQVSYDAFLNGDFLSVVIKKTEYAGDYMEYYAYNLNLATGEIATKEDLAKEAGIKEEDISRLLRKAVVYESDRYTLECVGSKFFQEEEDAQYQQEMYLDNLVARFHSIEESNLESNTIPWFLSEEGMLQAAVPIHSLAGWGFQYQVLTIEDTHAYKDMELSFDDAVFLSYKDGKMTIRIEENDWTSAAFYGGHIEFGKEYTVQGVYKDYVQGEMMAIINGEYVIPVFVSDDHTVSYLDIYECGMAGTFCLTEMAHVSLPVTEITADNEQHIADELCYYILERYEGFSKRIMALYDGEGAINSSSITYQDGSEIMRYQYLGFDEEDQNCFIFQESDELGDFLEYQGRCTYLGMDENGFILAYYLDNIELEFALKGAFRTRRQNDWDEQMGDFIGYLEYTGLSGDELFMDQQGTLELTISVG